MCKTYLTIMRVKRKQEVTDEVISGLIDGLPEEGRERYWRDAGHELGRPSWYLANKVCDYKKRVGLV